MDILFSKYPKHQMVMSSEHQLKIIELFTGKLRQLSCPLSSEYLCILWKCRGFALYFPHSVHNIQNSTKFLPIFLCVYSLRIIFVRLNYYLSHIIDTVESTYQCIFLDKIIKFLKHLVHYHPNIFAYCENAGVCALLSPFCS